VALQGTLDTFALPDVLRLLASTKKTGRLCIEGTRGAGDVWVADGGIVSLEAPSGGEGPVERLFELLRSHGGSFTFEPEVTHPQPEVPVDVEPLLADAEMLLEEWRLIESVVPSLASWVSLAPDLPAAKVTVDRACWRSLTAIAAGTSVGDLGERLELSEVPVSRLVKELVEAGLVEVTPDTDDDAGTPTLTVVAPALRSVSVEVEPEVEPPPRLEPVVLVESEADAEPALVVADGPTLPPAPWASDGDSVTAVDAEDYESIFPGLASRAADDDDVDSEEVARQLANLSPRAAKAVKAAAAATTDEEREAALASVEGEGDEPLNRGLLLKFLSSVRT
jgi:DNA-binding MarR family transcriptional regulator